MVRLRNAVMAFVLATGMTGCSALHGEGNWFGHWSPWHCDTCDDFPAPAYGPNYSLAPGSYTGPLASGSGTTESGEPAASTPPAGAAPGATPPATITTPPTPPNAAPGPGAGAGAQ